MARHREGAEIHLCQVSSTHGRKIDPGNKVRLFPQALPEAQPAELYVEVPENYGGNFPLYLTKVSLSTGWVTLPPSPASSTFSTPFSFCSVSLLSPAI